MSSSPDSARTLVTNMSYEEKFREVLLATFFAKFDRGYLNSEEGRNDIENHVVGRMNEFQNVVVPWIQEVFDLAQKSVIDMGCGTGSEIIPIARRAKSVYAYDVIESSLDAARARINLLGLNNIQLTLLDSAWARSEETVNSFLKNVPQVDVVLLVATLEHLIIEERINVLRTLWKVLKPGGIMVIYETPNRIGFFDWHTFQLPFFQFLPDQLALPYSLKTPRVFPYVDIGDDMIENLYRLGRGVSYHEFELALDFDDLTVINDGFSQHLEHRRVLDHDLFDRALVEIFEKHLPAIPRGFSRPSLDLILKKGRDAAGKQSESTLRADGPVGRGLTCQIEQLQRQLAEQKETILNYESLLHSSSFVTRQFLRLSLTIFKDSCRHPIQFWKRVRRWVNRKDKPRERSQSIE